MHSSVKHLHTTNHQCPMGSSASPPCLGLSWGGDGMELMSKHRQGLVLLTKWGLWGWAGFGWIISIRSPCQSVTEGAANPAALPPKHELIPSNTPTETSLVCRLEPHRQKGRGSKNNCFYPSLLILPLFHPHNLPSRIYSAHQWKWLWKLKYLRCNHLPTKLISLKDAAKGKEARNQPETLSCYETLPIFHLQQVLHCWVWDTQWNIPEQ